MKKFLGGKLLVAAFLLLATYSLALAAPTTFQQVPPLKRIDVGPVQLATCVIPGKGVPILFIHGSWDDHNGWLPVARTLRQEVDNPMVLYDRRGHSASTNVAGQGHISDDVEDAVELIQKLHLGAVHVVGHSYGSNVAIELVNNHPELAASLFLYEPPAFGILKHKPQYTSVLKEMKTSMLAAKALLGKGDIEEGTKAFVENVAFGKNSWENLFDERARSCMIANADTWLDQSRDKERLSIPVEKLRNFKKPMTLVSGDASLPVYQAIAVEMQKSIPALQVRHCKGAGHGGPVSDPQQVADFLKAHLARVAGQ